MQQHSGSTSAGRRAVRDTGWGLGALWLDLVRASAPRSPCPDADALDDNALRTP